MLEGFQENIRAAMREQLHEMDTRYAQRAEVQQLRNEVRQLAQTVEQLQIGAPTVPAPPTTAATLGPIIQAHAPLQTHTVNTRPPLQGIPAAHQILPPGGRHAQAAPALRGNQDVPDDGNYVMPALVLTYTTRHTPIEHTLGTPPIPKPRLSLQGLRSLQRRYHSRSGNRCGVLLSHIWRN